MKRTLSLILVLAMAATLVVPVLAADTTMLYAKITANTVKEEGTTPEGLRIIRCSLPVTIQETFNGSKYRNGFCKVLIYSREQYKTDSLLLDMRNGEEAYVIREAGAYRIHVMEQFDGGAGPMGLPALETAQEEEVILLAGDAEYVPEYVPGEQELKSFDDLPEPHWAHPYVMRCVEKKAIQGTRDPDPFGVSSYEPDRAVTRGEFMKVLASLICPQDVTIMGLSGVVGGFYGHWAWRYMSALSYNGILKGTSLGNIEESMDTPITREEMAQVLYNAAEYRQESLEILSGAKGTIQDYTAISTKYRDAVLACYSAGLISGHGNGSFAPKDSMTRAEMAVVICRLVGYAPRAAVNFQ